MDYANASAAPNPHGVGLGLSGAGPVNIAFGGSSPSHFAAANKTSELPAEAMFEMMRFQLINSSLNTDITRGVQSLSSALSIIPSVIKNIS